MLTRFTSQCRQIVTAKISNGLFKLSCIHGFFCCGVTSVIFFPLRYELSDFFHFPLVTSHPAWPGLILDILENTMISAESELGRSATVWKSLRPFVGFIRSSVQNFFGSYRIMLLCRWSPYLNPYFIIHHCHYDGCMTFQPMLVFPAHQ